MLPPTGFWSYTTSDDTSSRGKLSQLRALLAGELQQQIGREPRVNIFQDVAAIPPGSEWERQIRESIDKASFIIPIVTPGFLQSEWCCREVTLFREREQRLGVRDLVFPIHYVDTEHLDGGDREVLKFLRTRQWIDFRHLRFKSLESEDVALLLETLSRGVLKALRAAWLVQQRADTERKREEAVREAAEAKRRDAAAREARLVEEARQREVARQAEAARQQAAAEAAARREEEAERSKPLEAAAEDAKAGGTRRAPDVLARQEETQPRDALAQEPQPSEDDPHRKDEARRPEDSHDKQREEASGATPSSATERGQTPAATEPKRSTIFGLRVVTIGGLILVAILLIGGVLSGAFITDAVLEAANRGDAHAMYALGQRYYRGESVPQDYGKARDWYERAAAAGNAEAMFSLGNLYMNGRGVPKDSSKALDWIEKSAAAGDDIAMLFLGMLYENGGTVPQHYGKAREWYAKAAAAGNALAMGVLGGFYEHGLGVPQNYAEACDWYKKSLAAGYQNDPTVKNLARLRDKGLCGA